MRVDALIYGTFGLKAKTWRWNVNFFLLRLRRIWFDKANMRHARTFGRLPLEKCIVCSWLRAFVDVQYRFVLSSSFFLRPGFISIVFGVSISRISDEIYWSDLLRCANDCTKLGYSWFIKMREFCTLPERTRVRLWRSIIQAFNSVFLFFGLF